MLSYERPAAPGTYAWQNEHAWRLANTASILARQKDGGRYLPGVDAAGNAGAWPTDGEHQGLIGVTQPGAGMGSENRATPVHSMPGPSDPVMFDSQGAANRSIVDVHVHDNRVIAKVRQQAKTVLTKVATAMPLPAGGP